MSNRSNELTAAVIKFLNYNGFKVWRQNNLAAQGRTFKGLRGVPDVIGFKKVTGRFIGVEIKTGKDKLSLEQINFAIETLDASGYWFECRDINSFIEEFENTVITYALPNQPRIESQKILNLEVLRNKLLIHANNNSNRNSNTRRKGKH